MAGGGNGTSGGNSGGGSAFSFSNLRRKSSSLFSSNLTLDKPRRDSSPTRLKRAVGELAAKVKRVTTGRHLGHLEVPKIEFGSPAVKTNDVVAARGRRPSIAPVPAMLGDDSSESETSTSDQENNTPQNKETRESQDKGDKYFENQWTIPSERSV